MNLQIVSTDLPNDSNRLLSSGIVCCDLVSSFVIFITGCQLVSYDVIWHCLLSPDFVWYYLACSTGGRARRTRHGRNVDRMHQRHEDDNPLPQPGAPSNHCVWTKRDLVKEVERSVYV